MELETIVSNGMEYFQNIVKENFELKSEVEKLTQSLESLRQINQKLENKINILLPYFPIKRHDYVVRGEFENIQFSYAALQKLLDDYEFSTVLDIGAGSLDHSKIFSQYGKQVTAIDLGNSVYYEHSENKDIQNVRKIIGNFNEMSLDEEFDLVWASHILEHQVNVDHFLRKVISLTKEEGIIAITVPPLKHHIVGGHVSLWNAGLVLYRLVICGLDCKSASILSYGYNISVIIRKKTINIEDLQFDCGDIRRIKKYLPEGLKFYTNDIDDPFEGNISQLNW